MAACSCRLSLAALLLSVLCLRGRASAPAAVNSNSNNTSNSNNDNNDNSNNNSNNKNVNNIGRRAGSSTNVVASNSTSESSSAAKAYGIWYVHDWEYSYVEVLTLCVLLTLAMTFDMVWHKTEHHARGSYAFGQLQADLDAEQRSEVNGEDPGALHEHREIELQHARLSQ
ncbi:unnamed protein product, partial [Polarella glacialis]